MNQCHLARGVHKMAAGVRRPCTGEADKGPGGDTKIRDPGFAAELAALDLERLLPPEIARLLCELAALDLERLLPPEIARLLFGQDFLWIRFRVHGSQFFQTITSFSRTTP